MQGPEEGNARRPRITAPWRGADLAVAGLFTLVTLVLRLVFLFRSQDTTWPHAVLYEGDAPVWAQWARALSAGQPFEDDLPFRTPGVAFLLHWMGWSQPPFTAAKVAWCLMSALTVGAIHVVMARWFGRVAAAVAAFLTAVSFGSQAIAISLNNEVPYALLVTCMVGTTLAWCERPRVWLLVALDLMHGACLLLRAEHVALLTMLGVWMMVFVVRRGMTPARALACMACLMLVSVATCAPWMLRSRAAVERFNGMDPGIAWERLDPPWTPEAVEVMRALPGFAQQANRAYLGSLGRQAGAAQVDAAAVRDFFERRWGCTPEPLPTWSLVSFKGPLDFALANDLRGDGGFSLVGLADEESATPAFSLARPSHLHLVNHGYAVGWDGIRRDPVGWARLVVEKLRRFTDGITLGLFANDWPHAWRHVRQPIDVAVPERGDAPAWTVLMLALLGLGVWRVWRSPAGGVLLVVLAYRLLVTVAFYGYARHAVSIGPVLFGLTGLAVQWLTDREPLRRRASALRTMAIGGAVILMGNALLWAWRAPAWLAQGPRIRATPAWHPDAFEAVDAIALEPLPDSTR